MSGRSRAIDALLEQLGIERFVLAIHQASFPADADDIGIGTPYAQAGRRFVAFAASLGFDGIALGPGGITSRSNPSPYDASLFSLNPSFVSPANLLDRGLVDRSSVARWRIEGDGRRVVHAHAWDAARELLRQARGDPRHVPPPAGDSRLAAEARFEGAVAATGTDDWRRWPSDPPVDPAAVDEFLLGQAILRSEHARFRNECRALGLRLHADAQVGVSHRDLYLHRALFLRDYVLGAPPSRTNPEGQPWGYPVLDPGQIAAPDGAGRGFLRERLEWLASMHDGIRIDHPHGWVCPWVYRRDGDDPFEAVRSGARLFESPDLVDHPALARYARVSAAQIDPSKPRHDDDWVRELTPLQVGEYAALLALLADTGIGSADLQIEVLSTCPKPLAAVLAHLGLGRFRVLQKARVDVADDVYRSDNAGPCDWVMVGNHDTPPLRRVVETWQGTPEMARRAAYLSRRLAPQGGEREELERRLALDVGAMCEAMIADCFVGPAKRVIVFWADLFGEVEIYNRPGVISDENWTLRVPADFERAYAAAVSRGEAPSIERALQLALRARLTPER